MSLRQKPTKGIPYWLFTAGREKTIHLGPVNDPSKINPEKVLEALDYVTKKYGHYSDIEYKLIRFLPPVERQEYVLKRLDELEKEQKQLLSLSPSVSKQYKSKGQETAEGETWRRRLEEKLKKETGEHETRIKIVDYGEKQEAKAFSVLEMLKLHIITGDDPRKAVLHAMEFAMDSGVEGVGIKISGKLEGRHHRTEKYTIGDLQDLDLLLATKTDSSKIDKAEERIFTATGPVVINVVIAKKKISDKGQLMNDMQTQTKKRKH